MWRPMRTWTSRRRNCLSSAFDSSHVLLVDVQLQRTAFDQFRYDEPLSLGINLPNLTKIIKMIMNKDDKVVLKADDDGNILTIIFESPKDKTTITDFEFIWSSIEVESRIIQDISYKCLVRMPSAEFQRIIRDMGVIGDSCTISCTKEGLRFSASGEMGTLSILIRAPASSEKDEEQVVIAMEEPVGLTFNPEYLKDFTKAAPLSKTVTICMNPEVPISWSTRSRTLGTSSTYWHPRSMMTATSTKTATSMKRATTPDSRKGLTITSHQFFR